ncbi:MAG: hypothetical protein EBT02_17695 [Planctomycetia bacterium]|nr:hypothetical protein [Planctomycetia bacterium]
MKYAPRPKQIRIPSRKIKCPQCHKDIFARGLKAHVRMTHGVDIKQSTAVNGLDLFTMQDMNKINVPKKRIRPSYNTAQPELTIGEMLFVFGVSWLLQAVSKEIRKRDIK